MRNVREAGSVGSDPSWRKRIDADYNRRKKLFNLEMNDSKSHEKEGPLFFYRSTDIFHNKIALFHPYSVLSSNNIE